MNQESFSDRLREVRESLGLSQTAFARLGGVCKVAQIHYEAGRRLPKVSYLFALAAAGVDVAYLLTGKVGEAVGEGSDTAVEPASESTVADAEAKALEADVLRRIKDCFLAGVSGREILAIFHRVPEALVLNAIRSLLEAGEIDAYHPVSRRLLDPRTLA